jgi:hypothetical protein
MANVNIKNSETASTTTTPTLVELVKFDFQNELHEGTSSSCNTVYSGSVGAYTAPGTAAAATIPHGGNIQLVESGFGAPLSGGAPYGDFTSATIRSAQRLLYWSADNTTDENDHAAFRYLVKLYGPDTGASTAANLARSAAEGSVEAQKQLAERAKLHKQNLADLKSLASTTVPTLDQMIASLPKNVVVTDRVRKMLDHKRIVLQNRVDNGKQELDAAIAADNRAQTSRDSIDQSIRCNFENISMYYGDAERDRADLALTILRQALKYEPQDRVLANAYLDVFYNKAVAEIQTIKQAKVDRALYRLGLKQVASGFVIDKEIDILSNDILPSYRNSLAGLAQLLTDRGGVDVSTISSSADPSTPLGYYIFQREQPSRNKLAAQYLNGTTLSPVPHFDPITSSTVADTEDRSIFDGYKDYVMVLTILSDYLNDSADLARLYGMRGRITPDNDKTTAMNLIRDVQQETDIDVKLLQAMFADYTPLPGDASGVYAARQGIVSALGQIEGVKNFLTGTANALGFDPNFLILIK